MENAKIINRMNRFLSRQTINTIGFAKELGISRGYLYELRTKRKKPSEDLAERLTKLLESYNH